MRREFIDPLFACLGWDVDNTAGYAEAYKDVIHEDVVRVGGATKAPDYCFRIGGQRKFFVEAKKPAVDIKHDVHPAYQLRRYAWSAKLPLSVLTDFEEWAVYDCRVTPGKTDKASTGRVTYLTYDQYADRWDDIAAVFSKEAILQGSFDKFAQSTRRKRGTAEVDDAFPVKVVQWRNARLNTTAMPMPLADTPSTLRPVNSRAGCMPTFATVGARGRNGKTAEPGSRLRCSRFAAWRGGRLPGAGRITDGNGLLRRDGRPAGR